MPADRRIARPIISTASASVSASVRRLATVGAMASVLAAPAIARAVPSEPASRDATAVVASSTFDPRGHIDWALGQGHCTRLRICLTWNTMAQIPVFPYRVPVNRFTTTAREMILRAKAARMLGWDDYAFKAVFSTQLHNDDALREFNSDPEAVLRALDAIQITEITTRDAAWALLRGTLGI
jgi:hypothetical protein